jgi:hypothetical protein
MKLVRAHEHLEVLSDELAAFRAGELYRVVHEEEAEGSEHVFRAQVIKEPPPHLSAIIGDALQNMRSALEHLAWGLTPLGHPRHLRAVRRVLYLQHPASF